MKSSLHRVRQLSSLPSDFGFSLVEVMIAPAIAASVLTGAALAFNAIGMNQRKVSTVVSIEIGQSSARSYYDISGSTVNTYNDSLATDREFNSAIRCESTFSLLLI